MQGTEVIAEIKRLPENKAAMAFRNLGGQLRYWRTPSGSELDFIWTRGNRAIGIKVKAAATWRGEYGTAIKTLIADGVLTGGHGIYTGPVELQDGPLRLWPLHANYRGYRKMVWTILRRSR